MQIACQRFSCQKAVEVCYWSCKFRRNCKDWQKALAGEPGLVSIQSRLEAAAAKTGRAFDLQTLSSPTRKAKGQVRPPEALSRVLSKTPAKEAAVARVSVVSRPTLTVQSNPGTRSDVAMLSRAQSVAPSTMEVTMPDRKKRPRKPATATSNAMNESTKEAPVEKAAATKSRPPAARISRPKQTASGTIYLLLSKNGKYRELRESELLTQAATLLNNPALRLVKGQLLVPTISFQTAEE